MLCIVSTLPRSYVKPYCINVNLSQNSHLFHAHVPLNKLFRKTPENKLLRIKEEKIRENASRVSKARKDGSWAKKAAVCRSSHMR